MTAEIEPRFMQPDEVGERVAFRRSRSQIHGEKRVVSEQNGGESMERRSRRTTIRFRRDALMRPASRE